MKPEYASLDLDKLLHALNMCEAAPPWINRIAYPRRTGARPAERIRPITPQERIRMYSIFPTH